ncbi:MAG: sigma-70 family RNA polymerase sigma factor [Caulobacterales bacterium]|nr:sigma-70 family RNA polymerase sigma factor [Caulobacterales bacterium]
MFQRRGPAEDRRGVVVASPALDEARLLKRIADRDLRAFETLYRIYHPRLTRFLMNMLRRPQLAEEALNDTMMVVWKRPEAYNGTSKVSTWIFAIAYRTGLKARSRYDEPVEDHQAETRASGERGPEGELGQRQVQAVLMSAMGQLSAEHRAVVDLTYFHEAGYQEIAEILDCPVGTVKSRMLHARRRLKGLLAGELADWL